MSESKRTLLTIGVIFIVIAVTLLLYIVGLLSWTLIVPGVFVFSGLWILSLGIMRTNSSGKYERSGFSTMTLGLVAITVGGAWFLFSINWIYSLIVILLAAAGLTIATALQHK